MADLIKPTIDQQIEYVNDLRDLQPGQLTAIDRVGKWFLQHVEENLITVRSAEKADAKEAAKANKEVIDALREAISLIRLYHGEGFATAQAEHKTWMAYQNSPEMKRLNSIVERYTTEEMRKEAHNG